MRETVGETIKILVVISAFALQFFFTVDCLMYSFYIDSRFVDVFIDLYFNPIRYMYYYCLVMSRCWRPTVPSDAHQFSSVQDFPYRASLQHRETIRGML